MALFGIKFGRRGNSSGEVPRGVGKGPGYNNEILPPYSTKESNVLNSPTKQAANNLDYRLIQANPFDGFWLTLPAKLRPQQIINILRSAQGGDVWQLAQLHDLALTLWPMYKKCNNELKEAASSVKFDIHPYCEEGEEPTESAKEKADFVRRCISNLKPNPANDECDWRSTLYHLADVPFLGVGMQEIIWNEPERGPYGWERKPRATTYIHPRHFTYTQDGFLTVFDENYSRYQFNDKSNAIYAPDPDRFITAQYYSHMGSPLSAGWIRPLGRWLSVYIFNQEWMFNFAQKHGAPFIDMTYKPGTPDAELTKMQQFLANAASQGWVMHLEGTTIQVHPPLAQGGDNPQRHLAEEADKQCQILVLGQTLTTDMPTSGAGSYAASQTHMGVKQEKVESLANWMVSPLTQLVRAILRVNYGNEEECPHIRPDFTPTLDATQKQSLISAIGMSPIPFLAEEVFKLLQFGMPEEGDKVLINGKLGELGPTDDELSAIGLQGVEEIDQQLELQEQSAKIAKKYAPAKPSAGKKKVKASELRRILSEASREDLDELRELIVKAKEAPYANGEIEAVTIKINHIKEKSRFAL